MSAARIKAFAAQHRPTAGRFEWHGVRLAALVANNFESLSIAASRASEVLATRVSTRLASLWLTQVALSVVLLLTLREGKRLVAFATDYLNVWHDALFLLE